MDVESENLGVDSVYVLHCDAAGHRFIQRLPILTGFRVDWIGTKLGNEFSQLVRKYFSFYIAQLWSYYFLF